jgi:hypothetical protein
VTAAARGSTACQNLEQRHSVQTDSDLTSVRTETTSMVTTLRAAAIALSPWQPNVCADLDFFTFLRDTTRARARRVQARAWTIRC